MVVGIDTYHDSGSKGRSAGAIIASLNKDCTRYYSKVCFHMNQQEISNNVQSCLQCEEIFVFVQCYQIKLFFLMKNLLCLPKQIWKLELKKSDSDGLSRITNREYEFDCLGGVGGEGVCNLFCLVFLWNVIVIVVCILCYNSCPEEISLSQ